MQWQMTTLKNGLRVITSSRPNLETVSLGVWIKTGSAFEREDANGISHFFEHTCFKGTAKRTALQISEEIEDVGGQMNAYTSREFTAFYAKMLKGDTELALDVIADILQNAAFTEEELVKEREVVVQEIKQSYDTPDDIIFDYFQETAFPNQALGRTILGPAEKVRGFTAETLRSYLSTNYAAENMVVCAVGNIDHNFFVKLVEDRMSGIQPKTSFIPEKQLYKGGFFIEKRDIEQAHVLLGFEGAKYESEEYYPNVIFSTLFGGGMSSRLYQEIREKRGLVYTVYSFANSHTQSGLFGIYAATGKEELKELLPVVADEIRKVRTDMVGEKELARAKVQLKASMLMGLESSSSSAEVLARQMLLFNRIIPVEEMVDRVESVTLQDIQKSANRIFASSPAYTLLGSIDSYLDYEHLKKLTTI